VSRFGDDYDEPFPNAWWLWENSLGRAMSSARGQQALRDLEAALLALPEKKLISGALAMGGQVCAIGAYALHKGVAAGRSREEVMAELERRIPVGCLNCWHSAEQHDENGCQGHQRASDGELYSCHCTGLSPVADWNGDGAIATMDVGVEHGMAMTLACAIGQENDHHYDITDEQRYDRLLAWARARIQEEVTA
jgi:hypothetical protein